MDKKDSALAIFNTVDGYSDLAEILALAYHQAAVGKGAERHANNLPFKDQPMQTTTKLVGLGFPSGQVIKKISEAKELFTTSRGKDKATRVSALNAARRDLYGSIVYAAGLVIAMEQELEGDQYGPTDV